MTQSASAAKPFKNAQRKIYFPDCTESCKIKMSGF